MEDLGTQLQTWLHTLNPQSVNLVSFLMMFLEGAGIPGIPGIVPMIAQGTMIHQGKTSLLEAMTWGIAGNWLGSLAGYEAGKHLRWILPGKVVSRATSPEIRNRLLREGPWLIIISRTIGTLRTPVTLGAGLTRYPRSKYLPLSFIGSILHVAPWQYALWRWGSEILDNPRLQLLGVAMGGVVITVMIIRHRKAGRPADNTAQTS